VTTRSPTAASDLVARDVGDEQRQRYRARNVGDEQRQRYRGRNVVERCFNKLEQ
jgi:hypothetical protein